MSEYAPLRVKVWSEYGLFTQPEMKVERVSYPVMTPSAARGVLEAIFWKPEMEWRIREIQILKPIQFHSVLRNEVTQVATDAIKGKLDSQFFADEMRTQRHSLVLRDVAYVIVAEPRLREHATETIAKYRDMFRRRVEKGQCFHRPYMGCREFAAFFAPATVQDVPLPIHYHVGTMLFDMRYPKDSGTPAIPVFFDCHAEGGVVKIPPDLYSLAN